MNVLKEIDWVDDYWSGKPYPGKRPIWEIIVNGRAAVFGKEFRMKAYENIKNIFPESVSILEAGRIAAHLHSDLGQVCSWLIQKSETEFSLKYFVDMRDVDNKDFLKKLEGYNGYKNYADIAVRGDYFSVPDLSYFNETFNIAEPFSKEFFTGVHASKK